MLQGGMLPTVDMVVAEGHQFEPTWAYGSNDAELWGEGW